MGAWTRQEHAKLPQVMAIPIEGSRASRMVLMVTYSGTDLWNFSCTGSNFPDLENLELPCSPTGIQSEAWLLHLGGALQAQAADIL